MTEASKNRDPTFTKICFFVLSLRLLFVLVFILTIPWPIGFGNGILPVICLLCLLATFWASFVINEKAKV